MLGSRCLGRGSLVPSAFHFKNPERVNRGDPILQIRRNISYIYAINTFYLKILQDI
jgi:hypothetical protein